MKPGRIVILAVSISVAAHAAFFVLSPHMVMPGMRQVMDQTRRMFRLKDVEEKTASVTLFEEAGERTQAIKMTQQGPSFESVSFKKMIIEKKTAEDLSLDSKKEKMRKERLNAFLSPDREKFDAEEMFKTEAKKAKKDAAPEKKSLAERLLSEKLVDYHVASGISPGGVEYGADRTRISGPSDRTGDWKPSETGVFQAGEGEIAAMQGRTQIGDYEDIGQFLKVELHTYTEPGTGEKYFRLLISVKKGSRLPIIAKEIVFLIDSSKSITEEKLEEIKQGLLDSLDGLNPGDRFNVVAFRGDLVRFRDDPVAVTERTLREARPFIRRLQAVGQTDVENALLGIIKRPLSFVPSYIVLATDGRPTTGVMDSRRIIQEITRRNNMQRPIFCFGGGRKVNKYLLDFISYQNRGWSRFASTTHDIRRDFDGFYGQIKDPFLLNVRYRLVGLGAKEVYPKYLSDFYQGKPFILYGRFNDEDAFSMQLLGEIAGMTKEFIFKQSFSDATAGNADIAREWAFRKIYYLISRNTMGLGSPSRLRAEIDMLSKKYDITTPYDIEDGD